MSSMASENVLLDSDLSQLYCVPTKVLNQAVKRNQKRFPLDFMFRLTTAEARQVHSLRSQSVTLEKGAHRKYAPYVFTEHGIAMLSSVLNSDRAIQVNIAIIRTFVRMRKFLATHADLAQRLDQVEWRQSEQDQNIASVFTAIGQLMDAPAEEAHPKRRIGFPTSKAS